MPHPAAWLANLVVFGLVLVVWWVQGSSPQLYYRMVQEDGALEWSTFWAFLLAGIAFGYSAVAAIRKEKKRSASLFLRLDLLVAIFCLFVAMEEISWGQRLFGYRPPAYFLRENFQQELNVHNVLGTDLRKLALKAVVLGYGIVLPALGALRAPRRLTRKLGLTIPPAALMPAFLATFMVYQSYPWRFSGELVEAMLGLGFLATASVAVPEWSGVRALASAMALTAILGLASFAYSSVSGNDDPTRVQAAAAEIEALATDFSPGGLPISRCSVHKRVFSWAEKYGAVERLRRGSFASLINRGLPEERVEYFIDPWDSSVWLRHKCGPGTEIAFLYSFGPNRRRDSTEWEIRGDDIGTVFFSRP